MVSVTYGHGQLYDFPSNFLFLGSAIYTCSGDGAAPANDTTVCATLTEANDYWNGCYIKYLTGTNAGTTKEITDFAAGTLTHDAFAAQTLTGDTFVLSAWSIAEDGQTLATPYNASGDYLGVQATVSAGNTTGYVQNRVGKEIDKLTTTYPYCYYRAKSLGGTAKYQIVAEYDDATTSVILAEGTSTDWVCGYTALTAAKTLDYIRFYCNDAASVVFYDFALVYAGAFTFPNGAYGVSGTIPNRNVHLQVPSRQTTITQMLGSEDFEFNIGCDLTKGTWTRTGDDIPGQVFYDICHNAKDEAWQWLDTEREQMKVTLEPVNFFRSATGNSRTDRLDLTFKEYRLSDAGNYYGAFEMESYVSRWGLDL